MKSMLSVLVIALILSGCNGSSGGGSATSDTPVASGGGVIPVPPVVSGTHGNASYYSLSSNGAYNHSDITVAPVGSQEIAGHLFMNYTGGALEFGIHSPTCLAFAEYKDYSLINVTYGNTTDETNLSMTVTENEVRTELDVFDLNWFTKTRYGGFGALDSFMGTCSNGKLTLDNGGVVYSNGQVLVYKKANGTMYVGLSEDVFLSNLTPYNNLDSEIMWSINGNYVQSFESRAAGTTYTSKFPLDTPTTMSLFANTYTKKFISFGSVNVLAANYYLYNYSAAVVTNLIGLVGVINGKLINVMAGSNSSVAITSQDPLLQDQSVNSHYGTMVGNKGTLISIEQ